MDALSGTRDNIFITLEECQCITSISLDTFEATTLLDPQSCGLGQYQTITDEVAQCVGLLGQNNRTLGIQVTKTTAGHELINILHLSNYC